MKPENVDEIPEIVESRTGLERTMVVSKRLSLVEQTQQYNLYLMIVLTNALHDARSMPPMTAPVLDPYGPWASDEAMLDALLAMKPTPDELIHFVVYEEYEGARRQGGLKNDESFSHRRP